MALLEKDLVVKKSQLPGSGMGLFTRVFIPKGTRIVEYKGRITTWKEIKEKDWENGYLFYMTRNHVINARPFKKALARYANDAKGLSKMKDLRNNSTYATSKGKVYIKSHRDIPAGAEILVDYGKEYWHAVKHNIKLG